MNSIYIIITKYILFVIYFYIFYFCFMDKQKRNKTIRKPYDMTPEFWAEVEKKITSTSENFTVYVTRLIRDDLKRDS